MPAFLRNFFKLESSSGIILFIAALFALLWANSSLSFFYFQFTDAAHFWINDGLMTIFFLVVGLELKRGYLEGPLAHFSQMILPLAGALGGMLVPAVIYFAINHTDGVAVKGWPIPVATDIAFALGVLALFGKRVPISLRFFLLALAIFDDVGAIFIIVFNYSQTFSLPLLAIAAMFLCGLFCLNRCRVRRLIWYGVLGVGLWVSLLHSGVHPTIAGVLLAFTIPNDKSAARSSLHQLERGLHPWSAYVIMPLFAFTNAGVSLRGLSPHSLNHGIVMGIVLGLFIGKQLGVVGACWVCVKTKWATLPQESTWLALYGVAILCGIGFTMSLFLGTLAFQQYDVIYLAYVRIGVIIGSLISAVTGAYVLKLAAARQ